MKILEGVCRQCGDCAEICPLKAVVETPDVIYPRKKYSIDNALCNNCGKCEKVCKYKCIIWG